MPFRISVFESKELRSIILRLKGMDKDIASQINRQTRSVAEPVWKEAVSARVSDRLEARVIGNTARASVTRSNVTLKAGAIGRALTGGATPPELIKAVEFGAQRDQYNSTSRGRRRTQRQFKPGNPKGYVAYQAAAEVIPRIASLWVQTVVKTFHLAIEGSN